MTFFAPKIVRELQEREEEMDSGKPESVTVKNIGEIKDRLMLQPNNHVDRKRERVA